MAAASLVYTPVGEIAGVVERVRRAYAAGRTQSVDWRKRQLQGIAQMVADNGPAIAKAIQADLRRPMYVCVTLVAGVGRVVLCRGCYCTEQVRGRWALGADAVHRVAHTASSRCCAK